MSKSGLKALLKADLILLNTLMKVAPLGDDDYADALADLISNRVIDEIVNNARVKTGIALTTPDTINGSTTAQGLIE